MVLALTAALVAPYFIDWNHYRAAFEREAERALGRQVRVEGSARVRLLPFPSVTFTDVVVAGKASQAPAMTVDEFSMDAELAPLLRGEVLIFDMRLVRPEARIAVGADGSVDWAMRPSGPFNPRQVTLENVTVTDGSVTLAHGASGRTHRLENIDAELSAQTLAGPWRIGGKLRFDGAPLTLSVSTGSADAEGRMRVRVKAEPENYPVAVASDGHARFEDGAARYSGTFTLDTFAQAARAGGGAGEEEEEEAPGDDAPVALNRIAGTFALRHDRLQIDRFRFETGPRDAPYRAEGRASLELDADPRFSVSAEGTQLRFGASPAGAERDAPAAEAGLKERLESFARFVAELPSPGIPGTVSLDLPAIVAGDTTIREISLRAEPAERGWRIADVAATLPGRTRFEGQGLLTVGEGLSFDGRMLLAIRQPSGFAAWFANDVDEAVRRLPSAGFSADVRLSPERQRFGALELALGDARFTGRIARRQSGDARPSLTIKLKGGALGQQGIEALGSLFVSDRGVNRLAGHDVDLELAAGPVTVAGLEAETLDTAFRLRGGQLEIDRLAVGGLAGASLSATGQISDFAGAPTGKIDATVVAADLAPLFKRLAGRFGDNAALAGLARRADAFPGLFADSEINVIASAADDGDETTSLAVSADGVTGGSDLSFSLSGSAPRQAPLDGQFETTLTVRNEDAAHLYGLAGLPGLPLGLAGQAQLEMSASGSRAAGVSARADLSGDGLDAGFEGDIDFESGAPAVEGTARVSSADIEPWLATAGVALPGFGLGLPLSLSADVEWSAGMAVFSGLEGAAVDSAVAGDMTVTLKDGKPHLEGALNLASLDLAPAAEMVLGSGVFADSEPGRWPQVPFGQDVVPPFSAALQLDVDSLWTGYRAAGRDAAFNLRLDSQGLSVSDFTARLYGGRLEGSANLRNNGGTGLFNGQVGLDGARLEALLPQTGLSGRVAQARSSVTASGKSVGSMVASLSGSGSAALENLMVAGFDPAALAPVLDAADEAGNEIDAERAARFVPELVRKGRFAAGSAELALSIAGGVVRTPPLRLEADGATLAAEAALDLSARTVSASGTLSYDAGREAVVGAEPAVGFETEGPPGATRTRLDTEPMAQYLTQRALEREQARVERMQAVLLEQQRLRREARHFTAALEKRRQIEAEQERLQRELRRERERAEQAETRRQETARRQQEAREAETRQAEGAARPGEGTAGGAGNGAIQRAPLPPPEEGDGSGGGDTGGEAESGGANSRDAVSDFFRSKNLSVERLMELIGPED